MRFATRRRSRGYALIVAMIVLVFLTTMVSTITITLMSDSHTTLETQQRLAVLYAARAGLEVATATLMADSQPDIDTLAAKWAGDKDGETQVAFGPDMTFEVYRKDEATGNRMPGIVDEERKLNINKATPAQLSQLLQMTPDYSGKPEEADTIVKAIVARRKDRPFASVGELAAVEGVTHKLISISCKDKGAPAGIRSLLTVYGDGKINVNTAPVAVLALIDGLDEPLAKEIVDCRSDKEGSGAIKNIDEIKGYPSISDEVFGKIRSQITVTSRHFTIRSVGRLNDAARPVREVRQIVRRDKDGIVVLRYEQTR
jgi:type II secretory pathway component PulK